MENFEGKSLEELLTPLRESQRGFPLLRLLGFSMGMALTITGRNPNAPCRWRVHNSYFKEVESFLMESPRQFRKEADRLLMRELWSNGIILANQLIKKGIQDFDNLGKDEKGYILRVLETLKRLTGEPKPKPKDPESYDKIR